MRALVLSDTHFGAWTGQDLLRDADTLALLAPHLEDLDELVILGDLFDFLFARVEDAFAAAEPFLALVREHLRGGRVVFVAGNHDHHVIAREEEILLDERLATGVHVEHVDRRVLELSPFRQFLQRRLGGVTLEMRYPTHYVGDVLCTHGHYLDPHSRHTGPLGSRLLGQAVWQIAMGGSPAPRTLADYEAVSALLTEELYTLAQVPHGTAVQQQVYRAAQRVGQVVHTIEAPARAFARLRRAGALGAAPAAAPGPEASQLDGDPQGRAHPAAAGEYRRARAAERARRDGAGAGAPAMGAGTSYPLARLVRPGDPRCHALEAFACVVENLGWGRETDKIVFAHTHQPLSDVRSRRTGRVRYWNTGSWIYEPELGSRAAYLRYLRRAWPGTAVLIDTDEPAPRLLELRRHLNPLFAEAPALR